MDFKIVTKKAFPVIGKTIQTTMRNREHVISIGRFWDRCRKDGTIGKLTDIAKKGGNGQTGGGLLGIARAENAERDFPFVIAVENTTGVNEPAFDSFTVPASDWVVFETQNSSFGNLADLWRQIFTDFFPSQDYEQIFGDELEVYYEVETGSDKLHSEIWIPVRKKS